MAKLITERKISVLDSYDEYRIKYPKDHRNYLTKKDFRLLVKELGSEYANTAITTGKQIKFSNMMGALQAIKYKPSKLKVDFNKTRLLYGEHNKSNPDNKKSVKHVNRITKGYIPAIWWNRQKDVASFRNKNHYVFKLSRPNIRPNTYNKNNPKNSLISYFQEHGYTLYPTKSQIKK